METIINIGKFNDNCHSKDIIIEVQSNGCWHIISHESGKRPYPVIYINDKSFSVHRLIYERDIEPILEGNVIRHKCDNHLCVNPNHLIQGTQFENIQDKIERNRQSKGQDIGSSKLTNEQVIDIYTFNGTYSELKEKYNLTYRTISDIRKGIIWGWLTSNYKKGIRQPSKRNNYYNFKAISPQRKIYFSDNVTQFCKEHNLERGNVSACLRGKQKSCKKWTFKRI